MYIITARRITSGEELKYRNGLRIAGGYGTPLPGSSQFTLTTPNLGTIAMDLKAIWEMSVDKNCILWVYYVDR